MKHYNKINTDIYLREFTMRVDRFPMLHETISMNSKTKKKLFSQKICTPFTKDIPLKYYCGKEILINENLQDDIVMFGKYYDIGNNINNLKE